MSRLMRGMVCDVSTLHSYTRYDDLSTPSFFVSSEFFFEFLWHYVEAKFNAGRAQDPTISKTFTLDYTQAQWDALDSNQKALHLCNKVRLLYEYVLCECVSCLKLNQSTVCVDLLVSRKRAY